MKVIAHRGNSSQEPENTHAAFCSAINIGVDFLECDVQISKDNVPVVIHDGSFHRIARCGANVNELTLEEIRQIDVGSWFGEEFFKERIMTLEEFFLIEKGDIGMMLDLKEETFTECHLALIVGTLLKRYKNKHTLVGSLNPNLLMCFHGHLPAQQLIPIVDRLEHLEDFAPLNAHYYALNHEIASKELIHDLHAQGAEVWSWTVDDKDLAHILIERGVDGIITNDPKKFT